MNTTAIAALATPLIKIEEGCRLTAYLDVGGVWTIGYGCTGPEITRGTIWTQDKADSELARRLAGEFVPALLAALGKPLPDAACAALICMLWNVGAGAVKAPQFAAALKYGDPMAIAMQFPKWDKVGGQSNAAILARRLREQKAFLAAVYVAPPPVVA